MTNENRRLHIEQPAGYCIKVQGRLDERWADAFGAMELVVGTGSDGTAITTLTGLVADQAALQGLLSELYGLGLPLISVQQMENLEDARERRVSN
jgi:hypothetical protein